MKTVYGQQFAAISDPWALSFSLIANNYNLTYYDFASGQFYSQPAMSSNAAYTSDGLWIQSAVAQVFLFWFRNQWASGNPTPLQYGFTGLTNQWGIMPGDTRANRNNEIIQRVFDLTFTSRLAKLTTNGIALYPSTIGNWQSSISANTVAIPLAGRAIFPVNLPGTNGLLSSNGQDLAWLYGGNWVYSASTSQYAYYYWRSGDYIRFLQTDGTQAGTALARDWTSLPASASAPTGLIFRGVYYALLQNVMYGMAGGSLTSKMTITPAASTSVRMIAGPDQFFVIVGNAAETIYSYDGQTTLFQIWQVPTGYRAMLPFVFLNTLYLAIGNDAGIFNGALWRITYPATPSSITNVGSPGLMSSYGNFMFVINSNSDVYFSGDGVTFYLYNNLASSIAPYTNFQILEFNNGRLYFTLNGPTTKVCLALQGQNGLQKTLVGGVSTGGAIWGYDPAGYWSRMDTSTATIQRFETLINPYGGDSYTVAALTSSGYFVGSYFTQSLGMEPAILSGPNTPSNVGAGGASSPSATNSAYVAGNFGLPGLPPTTTNSLIGTDAPTTFLPLPTTSTGFDGFNETMTSSTPSTSDEGETRVSDASRLTMFFFALVLAQLCM
eukprot:TRINITY_DN10216_c0_g1_i1.p1 TRINITY_DN10216_c0_g1~~TRINITY_DN10216_c0_g1_i1.p1  ORF type:complete len:619 (-),score=146.36 TRINITY_DN10216_c0_g1_i1:38-1864(-)